MGTLADHRKQMRESLPEIARILHINTSPNLIEELITRGTDLKGINAANYNALPAN